MRKKEVKKRKRTKEAEEKNEGRKILVKQRKTKQ